MRTEIEIRTRLQAGLATAAAKVHASDDPEAWADSRFPLCGKVPMNEQRLILPTVELEDVPETYPFGL